MPAARFVVDEWHSLQGNHKAEFNLTAKVVRYVVKAFFKLVSATKTERQAKYQYNIRTMTSARQHPCASAGEFTLTIC